MHACDSERVYGGVLHVNSHWATFWEKAGFCTVAPCALGMDVEELPEILLPQRAFTDSLVPRPIAPGVGLRPVPRLLPSSPTILSARHTVGSQHPQELWVDYRLSCAL